MKTCLTCGANVADDADVCPDCGMEFESAVLTPQPISASNEDEDAGFTIDFSDDAANNGSADDNSAVAPVVWDEPDFTFSEAESKVALEKPAPAPTAATASEGAHITLRRGGALTKETFRFASGAVIGRFDPDSGPVDVDLAPLPEASYVSRHHAEFRRDAGNEKWFVRDMGSSNGTFWRANGAGAFSRLSGEQEVNAGDEISLGNARFEFGVD